MQLPRPMTDIIILSRHSVVQSLRSMFRTGQGQRGSALVSLAHGETPAWPPSPKVRESKFASRVSCANTVFVV